MPTAACDDGRVMQDCTDARYSQEIIWGWGRWDRGGACAEAVPLQFDQIDAIRSKLSEQWPSASELEPDAGAAVSVCVPAVASNIDFDLPRLLQSIGKQTSLPEEVVIVISDTQGKECSDIQRTLKAFCERVALNV